MSPPDPPVDSHISAQLQRLENKLDTLIEDVSAPPRHGESGGLLFRMKESETTTAELSRVVEGIEKRVSYIEATPGKTAITWWDRLGLGLLGVLLSVLGAAIGATVKGGH